MISLTLLFASSKESPCKSNLNLLFLLSFVLLESFNEEDLQRSSALLLNNTNKERAEIGQLLIGVNSRNLRTLEVDPKRLQNLAELLPAARCVAESGLSEANDAARVAALGYRMALVGTALMRSNNPKELIAAMRKAGATT